MSTREHLIAFVIMGGIACSSSADPSRAVAITAGDIHTCAILESGDVRCWGTGRYGRLGTSDTQVIGDDEPPLCWDPVALGAPVMQVSAGKNHTCALLDGGSIRCWGRSEFGQLGYGSREDIGDDENPLFVDGVDLAGVAKQVQTGGLHTCALLNDGAVRCWGENSNGQLGYGNTVDIGDDEHPSAVGTVRVGGTVTQIAVGYGHTCALLEGAKVRCWGRAEPPIEDAYGGFGQLGYGNFDNVGDDELPEQAGDVDVGGDVVQITAGYAHTCAILRGGTVRCWGRDYGPRGYGQLGYAIHTNIGDNETPASAGDVDVGGTAIQIAAGDVHTCALLEGGSVRCWGFGGFGQLGYANQEHIGDDEVPASAGDVELGGVATQIAVGTWHTCALLDTGHVRCWGLGANGQLGYGNDANIGDDETPSSVEPVEL